MDPVSISNPVFSRVGWGGGGGGGAPLSPFWGRGGKGVGGGGVGIILLNFFPSSTGK